MPLTNGVKPQSAVHADFLFRFQFQHFARVFAKKAADIIIIINLAKKANALAVFTFGIDKMFAFGNLSHLSLLVMTNGKYGLLQLPIVYLCKEVGLVFHWVGTRNQPFLAVNPFRLGIMSRCDEVVFVSALLMKCAKLNQSVAHHVGIGCKSRLHLVHRVACNLLPILLMAVNHLQFAPETFGYSSRHLQVFFGCTIPFFRFFGANLDVKAVGVQSKLVKLVHHHRTIYPSR